MDRRINGLSIVGIIMLFVSLGHLIPMLVERGDIWWTPKQLALSLGEAEGRVRIYLRDEPIEDRLEKGCLYVVNEEGNRQKVGRDDVRLRLNNWDRRRASLLTSAIIETSAATAGFMLLVFGLFVLPAIYRRQAASTPPVQTDEQGRKS